MHGLVVENTGWIVSRRKMPHSRVKRTSVRGNCEEQLYQSRKRTSNSKIRNAIRFRTTAHRFCEGRCRVRVVGYRSSLENRAGWSVLYILAEPHDPTSAGNWSLATSVG